MKNSYVSGLLTALFLVVLFCSPGRLNAEAASTAPIPENQKKGASLDAIIDGLEHRYKADSFSALFYQESPLPDIQITEKAQGKAFFKRPGKFRWSYETPDVLDYISNGDILWIHSPADNNVWIGHAGDFFGKEGSAAVLTDIKQIRTRFHVALAEPFDELSYHLKLKPKNSVLGVNDIDLSIDRKTFDILKIISFNMNGEETRVMFRDMNFNPLADDSLFNFTVPENAIVIPLD
ncbi:MAG: outer membrane lipoprotein carrier protein LolA [Proteobacteria bacterium]|nr:outer membrane lipoprotein carrier protein LolA [Pseudomonadota bacterium]